jgi:hypothetical protein
MLTIFWFRTSPGLGYGVTAFSQRDAEAMLSSYGYPREGEVITDVIHGIKHYELDQNHVVPNAGPVVVRGIWYPNHNLSQARW